MFVLDNSVLMAWLLETQATPYTEAVFIQARKETMMGTGHPACGSRKCVALIVDKTKIDLESGNGFG
jgi:hypothetical protein